MMHSFLKKYSLWTLFALVVLGTASCSDDPVNPPALVFKFKFDSTQARLNNIGQPAVMPSNHRGQNPSFNKMSAHYIELSPNATTLLGQGAVLYQNASSTAGGADAIDFNQAILASEGEIFLRIPFTQIPAGTYEWIRVSLAYQNYDIRYRVSPPVIPFEYNGTGTIASFIGYNTYITTAMVKTQQLIVNANKLQGFWAFETITPFDTTLISGQAPPGATTVPNPIFSTSPIPQGSCVVTGPFNVPLIITGAETEDRVITLSLSTNQSFEWKEAGNNNVYEPLNGDTVVDMGIRGLIPILE